MFYTGIVTDQTGLPMAGIRVSDGRNVTLTDAEGRYQLPGWEHSRVLHVGVLTQTRDDWFVCTGGEAGQYDFSIKPVAQAEDFCFLHMSDTEINSKPELDFIGFVAENVKAHKPLFLLNTGDLFAVEGTKRHAIECSNELVGCPVRYCIGNHDFTLGDYGEQLFESLYGPTWCSFDLGQFHFVFLSIGKGDKPSGYAPEDQFAWLENDLKTMKPGQKLIVCDHDCCSDEITFVHTAQGISFDIGTHGLAAWIMGHFHTAYDIVKNGVHLICSANPSDGGIDSSAAGVRKVIVSGTSITSEFIYNRQSVAVPDESIWRCKLPCRCEHSQPVLHNGDLFVATMDYGFTKEAGVYRICGETGTIKWFFSTRDSVKGGMDVQDGQVYLQDCGGMLSCLDAKDGSLLWQRQLPLNATCYTRMNVLARRGVVVAGRPRQVFGCDMDTGEILWTYSHKRGGDTPAMLVYDEARQRVILCGLWYMTAALDIKTGEFMWQETEHPANLRTNTPCISGNILYGSGQNWVYCHDLATGKLIRKVQKDFYMDSRGKAVVEGDVIYYSTGEKGVVAMDKESFDVLRVFPAGPAAISTAPYLYGGVQTVEGSPVIDGDKLIFAGSDGMLRIYNKHTAVPEKAISIGAPCIMTPIVACDTVYTADFDGFVTKFRL